MRVSFSVSRQTDGTLVTYGEHTNQDRREIPSTAEAVDPVVSMVKGLLEGQIAKLPPETTVTMTVVFSTNPPR